MRALGPLVALSLLFLVSLCVGCPQAPPSGPGTAYPCGTMGKVCDPVALKGGAGCCGETDDCGGVPGCPPGYCCAADGAPDEFGAKRRVMRLMSIPPRR